MARAEERGTAISNELIFVELEWAEVPDEQRRRAARRRPPRVLPSLPRVGAPLPSAPAERAGGAHPLRQVAHREQRVGAAVLRAHVGDHRRYPHRRRRHRGEPRAGALAADVARARRAAHRRGGRHRRARARAAHARVRVQHAARRQVDRRPAAQLPVVDREPQPRQRGERRVGAGAGRRGAARATTSRSAGTRSRRSCSASTAIADYDRMASVASSDEEFGWDEARRARARRVRVVLARPRGRRRAVLRRVVDRRADASGQAARARSARTPCRASTRTCCSTGPRAGATCSRWRTRWATVSTRTSRASRGSSTRPRR